MLDLEEFRRIRDETALARYKAVLPQMRRDIVTLSDQCRVLNAHYKALIAAGKKREAETYYDSECREVFRRWAELSADIGEIERDIPRRKVSLQQLEWRVSGSVSDNKPVISHNGMMALLD